MKEIAENKMGIQPIGKLLRDMSMPLIISMFVQVLYGMVDSLYVSRIGENALTAISLCMPIQYLVVGVGVGLAVGTNAILSKKLGEQDNTGVSIAAGNGFLVIWIASIAFILIGLFAVRPFYEMQTDVPEILEMCISYSMVISIGGFAALHQMLLERLLTATGKSNLTMISMLSGAVINIVLDPILIFGYFGFPQMGIAGAAIATVLAQIVASIVGLLLNLKYNHDIHFHAKAFLPHFDIMGEIMKIGIPVALSQCLISVIAFGMNQILLGLSLVAPGIYVIYIRLQSFIIMPASGMSNAGVSMIAYNFGAKNRQRVIDTVKVSVKVNAVIAVIGILVFLVFPKVLLQMFDASEAMMQVGIPALRIIAVSLLLTTTTQILCGLLQALGKGTESFIIAIAQAVFLLLAAWLLSLTGSAILVWLAFPIMEILRFILTLIFVNQIYNKEIKYLA